MNGLHESILLIQETAVEAAGVKVVPIEGDPRTVLIATGTSFTERKLPPRDRHHEVFKLEDLLTMIESGDGKPQPSVWYCNAGVTLVFDMADRRDAAIMMLDPTATWAFLTGCARTPWRGDAKQLLQLLRTTLADAVSEEQSLQFLSVLKTVKLVKRDESSADLSNRGREAMGRSVEQEVAGGENLPERLEVETTIYRQLPELNAVTIPLDVSIDFDKGQFVLAPIGDSVPNAIDDTMDALGEAIAELIGGEKLTRVGLYHGRP